MHHRHGRHICRGLTIACTATLLGVYCPSLRITPAISTDPSDFVRARRCAGVWSGHPSGAVRPRRCAGSNGPRRWRRPVLLWQARTRRETAVIGNPSADRSGSRRDWRRTCEAHRDRAAQAQEARQGEVGRGDREAWRLTSLCECTTEWRIPLQPSGCLRTCLWQAPAAASYRPETLSAR